MASSNSSIALAYAIWLGFFLFFGCVQLCLCFSGNSSKSGSCIERERKALLSVQKGINDSHKWLSWNGKDCCRWRGVRCHTKTGHVVKLDLHYPYPYDVESIGDERRPNKSEISASLLDLRHLNYLDLSMNYFDGAPIPNFIGSLANLEYLNLSNAGFGGTIPHQLGNLKSLEYLYLGFNSLNGSIPESLGKLFALSELDLSSNNLSGALTEAHFANLQSLLILDMSHNSLTVNVSQDWLPPFKATRINMRSCPLGPKFPSWLRNQTNLSALDLSSAGISENFPDWFWDKLIPYSYLNVSHNRMEGKLPDSFIQTEESHVLDLTSDQPSASYPSFNGGINDTYRCMDLSSNLFSGPIPSTLLATNTHINALLLAHNRISGSIPSSFCYSSDLIFLNLADNDLTGVLPDCWNYSPNLSIIDFADNKLSGDIPSSLGSLTFLCSLHLGNNNLSGKIPLSLQQCKQLITLDLGNNKLSGRIPEWIGNLSSLKLLRLRSNILDGNIPMQLSHLASLQVLDLAGNKLSGTLPPSFGNFKAIIVMPNGSNPLPPGDDYYNEHLQIIMKGQDRIFTTVLSFVTSLDLSDNNISGEIPKEFTNLHGLYFLNLSRNHLTGRIPKNIGAMRQLESLDLSMNNLSSTIPISISNLNFLNHLNLSHNNLSGPIPSGSQLQTFNDPSIYIGNRYLCGLPLLEKCPSPTAHGREEKLDENDSEMILFFVSLSPGFVVGFWGFLGAMMLKKSTRYAYIRFIDRICDWIYMVVTINSARPKSKRNQGRIWAVAKL